MDIAVYCFADEPDYGKFQAVTEDINLKIMKIVADSGASIARVPYDVTLRTGLQEDGQAAQLARLRSVEPGPGSASGDGPDAPDN
jgi:hypothetical protein